jgi:oligopeptide/dipeptide ABC transporter ATP-binding protein
MVMHQGKIIESGTAEEIYHQPKHPYTQALIAAIPGKNLLAT